MALSLYNTLTRQQEPFAPLDPANVRMYVCGMTVYDYCHVGHARVMVVFDMVQRWLRAQGYQVTYVRNITDIDDKIIRRALDNKESITSLTNRYITAMNEDADALDEWTEKVISEVGTNDLEVKLLSELPKAIRARVLRRAIYAAGAPQGSISAEHLAPIEALVTAWEGQGECSLPGGVKVLRISGRISLSK